MATVAQLIFDVIDIASSGAMPTGFRIEDTQVLYWINQTRAQLIAQAIQKKADISDSWLQQINCFEMQKADISDCCEIPSGCFGLKSVKPLPNSIEADNINYYYVTGVQGDPIQELNRFSQRYTKFNKYTANSKGWFIKNNFLYLVSDQTTKFVTVTGLFEDPSDLINYRTCSGEACWSYDSQYPVGAKMASDITNIIVKTKILPYMQFPLDDKNDANNLNNGDAQRS